MSGDALMIGIIGVMLGILVGRRWLKMQQANSGYRSAVAGVPKAKAAVKSARTAWMLAMRGTLLAAVLLFVYFLATTTAVFQSAK
ncbi:hypothetical protein Cme02nite_27830 [Catellatospora methionotrophica]|uniref:Uncharacterized protein n=1 Tax=Catellatospora methionotrophica TaxID=121620 RepID=A0A8J3LG00_9ACTN|nr:hypothetical protein [Catellatospora methionotrophica]GIG14451.1 hypothetical protein Cme02nite_27830 [Catellatospora methionotrophica]